MSVEDEVLKNENEIESECENRQTPVSEPLRVSVAVDEREDVYDLDSEKG